MEDVLQNMRAIKAMPDLLERALELDELRREVARELKLKA